MNAENMMIYHQVFREDYIASHRLNSLIWPLACFVTSHVFTVMCGEVNEDQISDITQNKKESKKKESNLW